MAPRTRKGTTSRKKSWEAVVSAIDIHGEEVANRLAEVLRDDLRDGEEMPDVLFFFRLLRRRLARFGTAMVEASEKHLDELTDDDALRQQRDAATSALTAAYQAMRGGYVTAYGDKVAAGVGFEKNVATDPASTELQVGRLIANLRRPDLVMPPSRYPGIAPQPADTVGVFLEDLGRLKEARASLGRARSEADGSQLGKNEAVTSYDGEFLTVSHCFESFCALIGRRDLAERVRPSARRPGRRKVDAASEPGDGSSDDDPTGDGTSDGTPPDAATSDDASPGSGSADGESSAPETPSKGGGSTSGPRREG